MRAIFMLVVLFVEAKVWRKCIHIQKRVECKGSRGNITCRDIPEDIRSVEVLVLRRVYLSGIDLSPACLPQLNNIMVERSRNLVCKDFKESQTITLINNQSCIADTVSFVFVLFRFLKK